MDENVLQCARSEHALSMVNPLTNQVQRQKTSYNLAICKNDKTPSFEKLFSDQVASLNLMFNQSTVLGNGVLSVIAQKAINNLTRDLLLSKEKSLLLINLNRLKLR